MGTIVTLETMVTMENGKNFNKSFDEVEKYL